MAEKTATKEGKEFKGTYTPAIGRRKTAVAQVRLYASGDGTIVVNGKPAAEYFPVTFQDMITDPLKTAGKTDSVDISAVVHGGGKHGQAEALRHGIARALLAADADIKPTLKAEGFLTRDPRAKERKKPGLKKARRAPQWSKR